MLVVSALFRYFKFQIIINDQYRAEIIINQNSQNNIMFKVQN